MGERLETPAAREGGLPTIRERIAVVVMVCAFATLTGLATLVYHFYERERVQLGQDALQTARALVAAVDRDLSVGENVALALAKSRYIAMGDLAGFHAQAKSLLRDEFPGFTFVLCDPSGQQLVNTIRPFGDPLPRHGNPQQLQKVLETGRSVISDVYIGGVMRRPLTGIDVPVWREGKVAYVLAVGFLPERLGRTLGEQRLPHGRIAAIYDNKGAIVARTHLPETFAGQMGPPELVQHMREHDEGTLESVTMEGISAYSAFSRSKVTGWSVAIHIPRESILEELLHSISFIVAFVLALLAAGFGMAWVAGGRIGRSVKALCEPALALGSGGPVVVPPAYFAEALEVARALETASGLLGQRTAERDAALEEVESRRLLQDLIDATDAIIKVFDKEGRCLLANRKLCDLMGKPISKVVGFMRPDFMTGDMAKLHRDNDVAVLASGQRMTFEEQISQGDELRTYLSVKFPLKDRKGAIYAVGSVMSDITERKKLELELQRSNTELEQFAYVTSHDLREPLRMVNGFVSLLEKKYADGLDAEAREYIAFAKDGAMRMDRLIQDLLNYARIGRSKEPFASVDLGKALTEAMLNLGAALADAKGRIELPEDMPLVMGDASELTRLLQNILGNALKYRIPDCPPVVKVSARQTGDEWLIAVQDNGIGIPPDQLERVFGIFQRLHTHQEYEGTGIGLAVCKKIVERHGGRIWIESEGEGKGSTLKFTLPRTRGNGGPEA
ncbi:MAG: PAS domain S-box protein [Rhodospirillales bacterium]|nr:MAG: PAS domain S-box protein [Rhodospirillales bacterium]